MTGTAERLERLLATVPPRFADISDAQAGVPADSGGWSQKQILGHLIDSAANNHQRLVRTQFVELLEFPGYEQEAWVAAQSYSTERWPDLVNLWLLFNRHLLFVMRAVPAAALAHECKVGGEAPMSLAALMASYVDHLEHHLSQILS